MAQLFDLSFTLVVQDEQLDGIEHYLHANLIQKVTWSTAPIPSMDGKAMQWLVRVIPESHNPFHITAAPFFELLEDMRGRGWVAP